MGRLERAYGWLDDRLGIDEGKSFLGKAFPAEDSFLLGEVALFSFVALVLTGIFLGYFYEPSNAEVEYVGSIAAYQGEELPQAFVSVAQITYDVPYGMFIRRLHHWAAHFFIAAIALHMLRVFFTGAYRNPREPNWIVGTALVALAMGAGFTGYVLPFDDFAAEAASIGYNVTVSVPLIGDLLGQVVFGGDFPTSATIPRMFFIHVFVIPVAITVLLALHMGILVRQKHTEAPREAELADETGTSEPIDPEDDETIVGLPMVPNQAAVSAVVFFMTLATLSLLAGFLPVHNIAEYGPYDPASTPAIVMPDWYLMWFFGLLKLIPSWVAFTIPVVGIELSVEFIGGVVIPGLIFLVIAVWPFIDYAEEPTHFTADPLERDWQTATGVAGVVFVMVLSIAGLNNVAADMLGVPVGVINPVLIAATILGPIGAWLIVYHTLGGFEEGGDERPGAATVRGGDDD